MSKVSNISSIIIYGRTFRSDDDDNSTTLTIPKEFTKELDIDNCRVLMTLLSDVDGCKHLLISKYYEEIVIE